jgi:hypothetical protein
MKERIAHVWGPYLDPDGDAHWPGTRADRDRLASRLLGASVVSAIDGWLEIALDQLHHDQSPIWRREHGGPEQWEEDQATRALFQSMSKEQRSAVQRLLVRTLHGAFFSALVKLDQFPAGTPESEDTIADIVVVDADRAETVASVGNGDVLDFHDRLNQWIEEFSEYAALFLAE